jgi:hypothetical protein
VLSGDEQRVVINQRIDGSLQVFDQRIRDAQDALNKERDKGAGSEGLPGGDGSAAGSAGAARGGGAGGGVAAAGGSSAGGRSGSGSAAARGSASGRAGGSASAGGSGPVSVPADVADGSDDDIVARQLREAAMKEKDPALRDKLWQEYRDYKKGAT